MGIGAGLMYLLDPVGGKRRRALLGDKVVGFLNQMTAAAGPIARDLSNRTRGVAAETQGLFRNGGEVSDEVLTERVRAELGQVVSHPGALAVTASHGCVTLRGPILASEEQAALRCVSAIRGVASVDNRLAVHQQPGGVPGLQGGSSRRTPRLELLQTNWSPTARLVSSVLGGALAAYGLRRRNLPGVALSSLGLGLLARGLTNLELRRLTGIGAGRRAVALPKTITIAAPIERVFALWSRYDSFPHFMSHVREVRDLGGDRSQWVVDGPAGTPIEWNAVLTEFIPNRVIAWESEPGAVVQHAGSIRFEPEAGGQTRVYVRLSYNPPAGAFGHSIAWLLGTDPKRQIDDDLLRMKTFIETNTPPHDAAAASQTVH